MVHSNAVVQVQGVFQNIEVLKNGKVVRTVPEVTNLITDVGLNALSGAIPESSFTTAFYGTGSSEPSPTDTDLDFRVAEHTEDTAAGSGINTEEGYIYVRGQWTSPIGMLNGNISELGIGYSSGSNKKLFARTLVRDAFGNPTSITVLADEQLRFTWEHRRYWKDEVTETVLVNEGNHGGEYTFTISPTMVHNWRAPNRISRLLISPFHAFTSGGSKLNLGAYTHTYNFLLDDVTLTDIYTLPDALTYNIPGTAPVVHPKTAAGAGYVDFKYVMNVSSANLKIGGILIGIGSDGNSTAYYGIMRYIVKIDPPIEKTSLDHLEFEFRLSFERYVEEEEP